MPAFNINSVLEIKCLWLCKLLQPAWIKRNQVIVSLFIVIVFRSYPDFETKVVGHFPMMLRLLDSAYPGMVHSVLRLLETVAGV